MMHRLMVVLALLAATALATWLVPARAQQDMLLLQNQELFKRLQRPPVQFTHGKHAELYSDCTECHHIYEMVGGQKKNVWSGEEQECGGCHKLDGEGNRPGLMNAFHANCTGCHRQLAAEGKKTGPVTCGECHVRNK